MKHKHCHLMAEYAKDAMETDKPWLRWETYSESHGRWIGFKRFHPSWDESTEYRRKPRTIRIGEYDVPEPCREKPERGTRYFTPNLIYPNSPTYTAWLNDCDDKHRLVNGLLHLTVEAAIIHGKALASLTQLKP